MSASSVEKELHTKWGISGKSKNIHRNGQTIFYTLGHFFSKFGAIAEIRIIDQFLECVGFGYAIIQMKNGLIAEAIILKSKELGIQVILNDHNIKNELHRCLINAISDVHVIMPPEPKSPSNILNTLNDDCLQEIFRYLPLDDICSVADVCVKFKTNAIQIFTTKFSDSMVIPSSVWRQESFLRNFWTKIKSLQLNVSKLNIEPAVQHASLLFFIKYCSNQKCPLIKLELDFKYGVLNLWISSMTPILMRLKELCLEYEHVVDDILIPCHVLTKLELRECDAMQLSWISSVSKVFNQLQRLIIYNCKGFRNIIGLMDPNAMLIDLRILYSPLDGKSICEIASKFPNLEKFQIYGDVFEDTVPLDGISLCPLKNLKQFGFIDVDGPNLSRLFINHLIEAESPVESLELELLDNNDYSILTGLPELERLSFEIFLNEHNFEMESIIAIVKNVKKLSDLNIHYYYHNQDFYIGDESYEKLATIQKLKKAKKLTIGMERISTNVSTEKIKKYEDVLELKAGIEFLHGEFMF